MARPIKEGMDYFAHDTDASNDEKIEALRALHGNDGYAFYFILLERIYRTNDAEMDISKPAIKAALISKIGVTPEKFEQILDTAFDVECLDREIYEQRKVLTSRGIQKRFGEVEELRAKWRDKRKPRDNQKEKAGDNSGDNAEQTPQSKEKESKEKESKRKQLFIQFWIEYPRKEAKKDAEKAWDKINPAEEIFQEIMNGLRSAKGSRNWIKNDGEYIPLPATWLRGERWKDEKDKVVDMNVSRFKREDYTG